MFINVRIVVVIIELFLEWFRLSVTSFCLFSHTLSFISSTLVVTGKQILLLLLLLLYISCLSNYLDNYRVLATISYHSRACIAMKSVL